MKKSQKRVGKKWRKAFSRPRSYSTQPPLSDTGTPRGPPSLIVPQAIPSAVAEPTLPLPEPIAGPSTVLLSSDPSYPAEAGRVVGATTWKGTKQALEKVSGAFSSLKPIVGALITLMGNLERIPEVKAHFQALLIKATDLKNLIESYTEYSASEEAREYVEGHAVDMDKMIQGMNAKLELSEFKQALVAGKHFEDIQRISDTLDDLLANFAAHASRRVEIYVDISRANDSLDRLLGPRAEIRAQWPTDVSHICFENTRSEVLEDLMSWAKDTTSEPLLWLNDKAGTGKTSLAVSFREHLIDESLFGASFFCSRDDPTRRNLFQIFPTLALGLANQDSFKFALARTLRDHPPYSPVFSKEFSRLFGDPFKLAKNCWSHTPVLIIDALDECDGDKQEAVKEFLTVLTEMPRPSPIKFFLTSRPDIQIPPSRAQHSYKHFSLQKFDPQEDIRHYLTVKLKDLKWLTNAQLDCLVKLAGNLFLYAATVQKYLTEAGDSRSRLLTILSSPTERAMEPVDKIYDIVLHEAFHRLEPDESVQLKRILAAVACVCQPLSLSVLEALLDIKPLLARTALRGLHSVLRIPPEGDGSGLISVFHASFSEYLTNFHRAGRPGGKAKKSEWFTPPNQIHLDLAVCCLDNLTPPEEKPGRPKLRVQHYEITILSYTKR